MNALLLVCSSALVLLLVSREASGQFPVCTVSSNCSGHASSVINATEDNSICNCSCISPWAGSSCNQCADGYNQSTYPTCSIIDRPCNMTLDCIANYTRSVSGTLATGCTCVCKGQAVQPRCSCPSSWQQDPQANCNLCAEGYLPLNKTTCIFCSDGKSCTYRGYASLVNGACKCACRSSWTGQNCEICPQEYDATNDCSGCNTELGYVEAADGSCVPPCSAALNCSGHAVDPILVDNTTKKCMCSPCSNQWSGTACETCLFPLNISANCSACVDGYSGYPNCTNATTTVAPNTTTTLAPNATTTIAPNATTTAAPNATTTMAPNATTMAPNATTTMAPNATTTAAPNATTLPPTKMPHKRNTSTVSISSDVSRSHTLTSNSRSPSLSRSQSGPTLTTTLSSSWPSSTPTSSKSKTVGTRSISSTFTLSQSVSVSATLTTTSSSSASLCAVNISDCLNRTNHSLVDVAPVNCFCSCRNQWRQMFCEYCEYRFNQSDDCGSCLVAGDGTLSVAPQRVGTYVIYPHCYYIAYVSANVTLVLWDAALGVSMARSSYFTAVAEDVRSFLNVTCNCSADVANLSVYVISWSPTNDFGVDVEILDLDPLKVQAAAACVVLAFWAKVQLLSLHAAAGVARAVSGNTSSIDASEDSGRYYFNISATVVNTDNGTQRNPCDPLWCRTLPPIEDPIRSSADLTGLWAALGVIGCLAASVAAGYGIWYRPRAAFRQKYAYRRGADSEFRRMRDVDNQEVDLCHVSAALLQQAEEPLALSAAVFQDDGNHGSSHRFMEKEV